MKKREDATRSGKEDTGGHDSQNLNCCVHGDCNKTMKPRPARTKTGTKAEQKLETGPSPARGKN
ncbi:hypothetical protein BGY98DRAFT_966444 [Russula aff. rugulosa BPL654]|nr:hypothetical protein BGY98DRAFT_966444 [Russula aff. rugulosa BPL654]